MVATKIDPYHWGQILEAIYDRSCVPFLGAAVNISNPTHSYIGLPLGSEVALRLIEKMTGLSVKTVKDLAQITDIHEALKEAELCEDLLRLGLQNLPRVALHVEVKDLGTRANLLQMLRDFLPDTKCQPSKLLEVLARLPFELMVTTNYDRLLERALDEAIESSWLITIADLRDAWNFLSALRDATEPVGIYLREQLSPEARQLLDTFDTSAAPSEMLQTALVEDLNRLLQGTSLYDAQRFLQVPLTEEIQTLLQTNPRGKALLRLNRLLLEETYPFDIVKSRKPYHLVVQPVEGFTGGAVQTENLQSLPKYDPIVYKIHGSFDDEESSSDTNVARRSDIILTEEDYIKFLTAINKPVSGIPPYIKSKFVGSRLLFLGYSLEDWDFRTLYKGLIETLDPNKKRVSYAIQWKPPKFWVKYWEQKGVIIYDYDIYQFAEELAHKYIARYGSLRARKGYL